MNDASMPVGSDTESETSVLVPFVLLKRITTLPLMPTDILMAVQLTVRKQQLWHSALELLGDLH
ncbi:hypothetical protein N7495_003808 [Penicillium taxi]|uniref:uncharacterized protein n=1 Tax=Penicillium taxi TaxID=168475 RepID=UPI002545949F|nr:uncharacterized protein N7495_003808 [Penicillium taxi]KAJ5899064.1 hypothetical protein N7495_003808 [Penicillium taxi]